MADVVTMPKLGFDMAEGTLVRWVIGEGNPVAKGAILAEIETDKATVEVESNYAGVLARHLVAEGDIVPVNMPIAVIAAQGETVDYGALGLEESAAERAEAAPSTVLAEEATQVAPVDVETHLAVAGQLPDGVRASPLARRMAEDMGIDLQKVKGSGPGGRVVKKDIQAYMQAGAIVPPLPAAELEEPVTTLPPAMFLDGPAPSSETVQLNRLRTAIGRRMVEAKQQAPHFYVTHEYDVEALLDLRKQTNALLPEDEKLSVNDFIVKAVALALRQFPNLNASLQGEQVVRHGQVNVGVAVSVEGGLLTVVNKDTDRKPLRLIAVELRTAIQRARDGKVRPDDIEGSTFSVSNLGMYEVENFIAIINPPEAAILAIGSARQVPVIKNGEVVPGWRMKASISVDHRISDGVEAARFMQALADFIEQPLRLLL